MRYALVSARRKAGLTQEQVADTTGIHRTHFNAIEQGRRTPSLTVAIKIAEALKVDVEGLFLNTDVTDGNGPDTANKVSSIHL